MQLREWVDDDRVRRCRVRVVLLLAVAPVAMAAHSVPSAAGIAGLDAGVSCAGLSGDGFSNFQDASTRVLMIPGMGHCATGEGAWAIDYLSYLEEWVEQGRAPERVIGDHVELPKRSS